MADVLVVGDSWSAGYDDALKRDTGGWAETLGVPAPLRQAVSGSTAEQWMRDFDGRLTAALNTPCDAAVVFLGGNDAFAAISDGVISAAEAVNYFTSVRSVLARLSDRHPVMLVGLYANPSPESPQACAAAALLNGSIRMCSPPTARFIDCQALFSFPDLGRGMPPHPTPSGYVKIAREVMRILEGLK